MDDFIQKRILPHVSVSATGCWEWQRYRHPDYGYGYVSYKQKKFATHRIVYTLIHGPIPKGMVVCHKCDVIACCNPEHLFVASQRDNMKDCAVKNRRNTRSASRRKKCTPEDFWKRMEHDPNGCWNWAASTFKSGYGQVRFEGKVWKTHRLAYVLHNGNIPQGMLVCHTCNNRLCCNPAHLYAGTYSQNGRDVVNSGRLKNAKLTREKAKSIRELFATGEHTQKELGEMFGVDRRTINAIVLFKRYVD